MEPMATTVAGDEPESAANIIQAKTDAIARPPRTCPMTAMAKRMTRAATPPVDIKDRRENEEGDGKQRVMAVEGGKERLGDGGKRRVRIEQQKK